jgi:hypothetical protein
MKTGCYISYRNLRAAKMREYCAKKKNDNNSYELGCNHAREFQGGDPVPFFLEFLDCEPMTSTAAVLNTLTLHTLCKISGFHGSDYEERCLLRYKNPVPTSQETHYVSATETSRLTLCEIWGFHGGDYEECPLLGYKTPVNTSQKTYYFSTTECSRLMLYKIRGFHGGDCEELRLLGYKYPVCTSQATHYVSATESSQLMLYTIWGFHGGDCEKCRLLRYKYPVCTSQETHYVSATESSRLMPCKIWGFHVGTMKYTVFWVVTPRSCETSVLTRATWHRIPEDGSLHYITLFNLQCVGSIQQSPNYADFRSLFTIKISV